MTRASMGGPAILPPGQIADPEDAKHKAPLFSTAKGQTTPHCLVTRRTPVNFGVCCLIDLIQRENAVQVARRRDELMEPWPGQDDAPDRHPMA